MMEGATTTMNFPEIFAVIGDGIEMIMELCMKPPLVYFVGGAVIFIGVALYKKLKH